MTYDAVVTDGQCVDKKEVRIPYTAEFTFRFSPHSSNRPPQEIEGRQIVTTHDGQIRRLSLSRHEDRFVHSVDQGPLRLEIGLPLESSSEDPFGLDMVTTTIRRDVNAEETRFLSYWGSMPKFEWQTRNGEIHGYYIMHPHRMLTGMGGEVAGSRTCFQNGKEAPKNACGSVSSGTGSGAGIGAILGGLAVSAAGYKSGLGESASVDLGVRAARDIERGEMSTDTYEAVQGGGEPPAQESTIQAAEELRDAGESGSRQTHDQAGEVPRVEPSTQDHAAGSDTDTRATSAAVDHLRYTSHEGIDRALPVDKAARPQYAGLYANEYQDPAVADFRYRLNEDGTARLEQRACRNCTHDLSGSAQSRDWLEEYVAIEWAPMLTDSGEPMTRRIKDMNGNTHTARVLVVILEGGRTMGLNHYSDNGRAALGGPHGVPRYR